MAGRDGGADDAPLAGGDEAVSNVVRGPRKDTGLSPKTLGLLGLAVAVAVGLLGWWQPWRSDPAVPEPITATSSTTTSSTALPPGSPVAPLTGIAVPEQEAVGLLRPALIAKIDGAREAMPQWGLDNADMVIELRVEGISRYLAVWHSNPVTEVGPVRSARTSDPDLLALFGRPLFSYSGGNAGVLSKLARSEWFQDVSHDAVPRAYRRQPERPAPHNLVADPLQLWDRSDEPLVFPAPLFVYRDADEPPPGEPVPGLEVSVGSAARFIWDGDVDGWRRWAHGIAHDSVGGGQIHPANVVVLDVDYVRSAADNRSPEAVSVGDGAAWVFSGGTMQKGIWSRPDLGSTWDLRDMVGDPMTLEPGSTWIVLADSAPEVQSAAEAEALLAETPEQAGTPPPAPG